MKRPNFLSHSPRVINPWSHEAIGSKIYGMGGGNVTNVTSNTFPTANLAILIPFQLPESTQVAQLFWHNGAAVSGNVDMGIYTADGRRLVSTGSTAQAGTSTHQAVDITDTILGPGLFYMAIALDNTTGTLFSGALGSAVGAKVLGMAQMASAFPLPTSVTFASIGQDYIPLMALTTGTVI